MPSSIRWCIAAAKAEGTAFVIHGSATDLKALSEVGYQVVAGESDGQALAISGDQSEALKSVTKLPPTINTRIEARIMPSPIRA